MGMALYIHNIYAISAWFVDTREPKRNWLAALAVPALV